MRWPSSMGRFADDPNLANVAKICGVNGWQILDFCDAPQRVSGVAHDRIVAALASGTITTKQLESFTNR